MSTVRFNEAWTSECDAVVWTGSGWESGLVGRSAGTIDPDDRRREIVDLLLGWRQDPSVLRAEELEPPSVELIDIALRIVNGWRREGPPPPDRVLPNGEGGLAFEWYPDPWFYDLELFVDGRAEWSVSKDARLVEREGLRWKVP